MLSVLNDYAAQPATHRKLCGAVNRMYAWGRKRGKVTTVSPTEDIEIVPSTARDRTLSLEELACIWHAAEELAPAYRGLVQLVIVTGQRRNETANMRWGEIDLTRGLWKLPAARTKARRQHIVPLTSLSLDVLERQRTAAGKPAPASEDLVLPTLSRDGRAVVAITGFNWLKRELDRLSGVTDWVMHDFRRSIVTICAEREIADIAVLDSLLNHASSATRGGVVGVYQRATLLEPMRRALAQWDALLREAIGLPPAPERSIVRLATSND
jgi:integrase